MEEGWSDRYEPFYMCEKGWEGGREEGIEGGRERGREGDR